MLEAAALEAANGRRGKAAGGITSSAFRGQVVQDLGMPVPSAMGTTITIKDQSAAGSKQSVEDVVQRHYPSRRHRNAMSGRRRGVSGIPCLARG
ncbi:hypothetical protein [Azospirillum melinis]